MKVPESAQAFGFVNDGFGSHSGRTMMLAELRALLSACSEPVSIDEYRSAILDQNVLLKNTVATRRESFRRLRELYGLDSHILLFRAVRDLWFAEAEAQPLLALLCVCARDPIFRSTANLVLSLAPGESITPQMISAVVEAIAPGRYSATTLATMGRNVISSWRQSGHLSGRNTKVRARANCRPVSVAYALFLGFLCDVRGDALLRSLWAQLLDAPENVLRAQATVASQQGWLEYRYSGDITDVSFQHLLRAGDEESQ